MVRRRTAITLVIVALICCALGVWLLYIRRKEPFEEDVQTNDVQIEGTMTDSAILDANINMPPSQTIDPSLRKRPCALYYTKETQLCNDTRDFWYQRPIEHVQEMHDTAVRNGDEHTRTIAAKVLEDRRSGRLPNGICKLEFEGMYEPVVLDDGTPNPFKSDYNNTSRGRREEWAYCFSAGRTQEEAQQIARRFADGTTVLYNEYSGTPFDDAQAYGRVAFTTFDMNSMCSKQVVGALDMPSSWMIIRLKSNTDRRLEQLTFANYNPASLTLDTYNRPLHAFSQLFEVQLEGNSLWLVSKPMRARTYYLQFDACGRVVSKYMKNSDVPMTLETNFGVPKYLLYRSTGTNDDTFGTLDDMKRLRDSLSVQARDELQVVSTSPAVAPTPEPPKHNYAPGLLLSHYVMDMNLIGNYAPSMSSDMALDALFIGHAVAGQPPKMIFTHTEVVQTPNILLDAFKTKLGRVAEGYIYLANDMPEGEYQFLINSDDASDLFIDGRLVSSHYNYHNMNNRGVKGTINMKKGVYYPFRARLAQWEGQFGMAITWRPPGQSRTTAIPPNVFYYDTKGVAPAITPALVAQERVNVQPNVANTALRIATLDEAIRIIEEKMKQYMQVELQNVISRVIDIDTSMMSNDGSIYVDIGPFHTEDMPRKGRQALIVASVTNICNQSTTHPSPVRDFTEMVYSITFWIRIDTNVPKWTPILIHGVNVQDSTPSVWIHPNDSKLRVEHPTASNASTGLNSTSSLPLKTWVPVVIRMNGTSMNLEGVPAQTLQIFVNGRLDNSVTLSNNDAFVWKSLVGKKLVMGEDSLSNFCTQGSTLLQHMVWDSSVITDDNIQEFSSDKNNPTPTTLQEVLDMAVVDGVYQLVLKGSKVDVYVATFEGKKWACVLAYHHKAGTNPELRVIKQGENWPVIGDNMTIGVDGSTTAPSIHGKTYSSGAAWGHVGADVMSGLSIREMLWDAYNGESRIKFSTNDRSVIEYVQTGRGSFPSPFAYTTLPGHTASIPGNAPHRYFNQGDLAMTSYPFWRQGEAHWGIRAEGNRWEVDDTNISNGSLKNTVHQIWIR